VLGKKHKDIWGAISYFIIRMSLWDLQFGDRVEFGYGENTWTGVVKQKLKKSGDRAGRDYYTVIVESDSGETFELFASVWHSKATRTQPKEFSVDKYTITTDEGDEFRLETLKKLKE